MENFSLLENVQSRPYSCWVEFRVTDRERFQVLAQVFDLLKQAKQAQLDDVWHEEDDEQRLVDRVFDLLDEQTLAHFWWPSRQEREEFWKRWHAIPVQRRQSEIDLNHAWDFESVIFAFLNGDYELVVCGLKTPEIGVLEFFPFGFPYGGTDCMKALIKAFDFQIIGEDDGTGYVSYFPV